MKQFASATLLLLFSFIAVDSFSQQATSAKPKLFAAYPDVIPCNVNEIARVFSLAQGQQTNVALASNFAFGGTVTSNEVKYSTLQSAVIKSPLFGNAILHISKRTKTDNSIVYTGRIIHEGYADGYELSKDDRGNYQLIKIDAEKVMPQCGQQK